MLNFNLPITLYECTAAFFNEIMITIQNIKQEDEQEQKESHRSDFIESEKEQEEELKDELEEMKLEDELQIEHREGSKGDLIEDTTDMI